MNKNKILFLEKRGCNFWENDPINEISDLKNYRLITKIVDRDFRNMTVEIGNGYKYRYYYKNNPDKKLKNPIQEHDHKLMIDTYINNYNGCFSIPEYEKEVYKKDYIYNSPDLLAAINSISCDTYNKIIFCDVLPDFNKVFPSITIDQYNDFLNLAGVSQQELIKKAGFREKLAVKNFCTYETNPDGRSIKMYYWNNCFYGINYVEFDTLTKNYCG